MKRKLITLSAMTLAGTFALGQTQASAVETFWHGQFRINSYFQNASKDSTFGPGDDVQASRLRFRPTLDFKFDSGVKAHIQLNIGHINSNITNARTDNAGNPAVGLRHGYISAPIPNYTDWTLTAGIVPMSDKFGDTLFSGDWDYNPLVYMLTGKVADIDIRAAHGNLSEGSEQQITSNAVDDLDQWFFDADTKMGLGASFYALNDNRKSGPAYLGTPTQNTQDYIGVRYTGKAQTIDYNAFAVYNWGKRQVAASGSNPTERKNSGFAVKAEAKVPVGTAKIGVLGVYASGDKDFQDATKDKSSSFITPMSVVGTTGYWGYTGKLNVQGPTDTGIDTHFVNIDGGGANSSNNLGAGIATLQANMSFPIMPKLDGYLAAGLFTHAAKPTATADKKYIGTDLYAQVKYMLWDNLNLEAGIDYAALGKGHPSTISTGESKNVTLLFSRLQLEF
ncbi:MAG: hypothetical protein HY893_06900 [Deltaproteobacteria bacterium]|nr:hypothetical protein [Deltaproteobacteria bacterium]